MSSNANRECWCDSGRRASDCCEPLLQGKAQADTAEALMRSRYSAFVNLDADYLRKTWHPATCPATIDLDPERRWLGLKIKRKALGGPGDTDGEVSFVARSKVAGKGERLEENSSFTRIGGQWVYVGRVVE